MSYFGDMALGSTINFQFTTIGTTGLPTQLAATTATTISVYPQSSTTQITAGATLTTDFDGITGLNAVSIALTSGNGFTTANDYGVVLATGTVGGTNILGYVVGSFSVENRVSRPTSASIVAGSFGNSALVATTFAAGAITSTVLAAGAIHSTIFTTGAIVATTFAANAINAAAIADAAIDAATFASGAITSTVLAAGAVHSTIFTTGAIVGTTFAANAINSTVVADNTIDAATFTAGAITSTVLAAGAIHSTTFTTGAIVGTTFSNVLPSNFSTLSISAAGLVAITSSIKKNATAAGFMFVMTDMTTHVPTAGLTVVGTRALDGAAFGALTNSGSIASVGSGTYTIDLVPADVNGNHVMLRFTNATADDLNIEIITQP